MADSLGTALRDETVRLLGPVIAAGQSARGASLLLRGLGYTDGVGNQGDVRAALGRLAGAATRIEAIPEGELRTWEGIFTLLEQVAIAGDAIDELGSLGTGTLAALGRELAEQLAAKYVRARFPILFRILGLLTLIDPAETAPLVAMERDGDTITRLPRRPDRMRLDRARGLVTAPLDTLASVYLPNGMATAADAHAAGARLFEPLVRLASALGLFTRVDLADTLPPPAPEPAPDPDVLTGDHMDAPAPEEDEGTEETPEPAPVDLGPFLRRFRPRMIVAVPGLENTPAKIGISITATSAEHPGAARGFLVGLFGELALGETRGAWRLDVGATGNVPGFVIGPGGVALAPGTPASADATINVTLKRTAVEGQPAFRFGAADGTRLELGSLTVRVDAALRRERGSIAFTFDTTPAAFVLSPGDGDGFLRSILSREARLPLPAGIVLSSDGGLRLLGGAGLDSRSGASIGIGPVTVSSPRLALSTRGEVLRLAAGCDLAVRLGPVRAAVTGLGVAIDATLPEQGRRWPASLDLALTPPTGAAIAIDSSLISGGGFLDHDPALGRYLGALSLKIGAFEIGGAGVLDTKLPGGARGYSLAAIASARLPRTQIGWGFTLDGLGAFIGINRSADVDALRAGVREGALTQLLSPVDPVLEAPAIIASLDRLFPAKAGRYVVGPTVRIGWGTPAMMQADVAILLDLPAPVRVIVLGAVQVGLPTLSHRIVDLRLDVLGVLDLGRKLLSVDASLHHSTLAGYPLTGDMALRMGWGDHPHFLLAIGGFHPRFKAPPGFPALRRVALTIGDNPRLRLEAYLALAATTIHLGARVDLHYKVAGLKIYGELKFDALIELVPLHLEAELEAKVGISYHGVNIASARLAFLLSGPRPWRARGSATIGILWWDVSVGFDVSWGDRSPPALPPAPDVAEILRTALAARSAWTSELPPGERGWLILRDGIDDTALRVHPLATLVARQRAVPLGLQLTAFGTVPLRAPVRFAVSQVKVANDDRKTEPVQDMFAPAQFAKLRPDQRLVAPSFESLTSGVRVRGETRLGANARVTMDHDTVLRDPLAPPTRPRPSMVPAAVAASAAAHRPPAVPRRPPPGRIRLRPPGFVLASRRDLAIDATGASIAGGQTSYAALREALAAARAEDGTPVTGYQIVPRAETSNPKVRVVVVKEDENMRNTDFVDTVTGDGMKLHEFVQKIRDGAYPGYAIRKIRGVDTPVSKPTAAVDDNLG